MSEATIDSDEGVFVVMSSARPKLSERNRKIYSVFLALCTLSLVQTICQMPPQIYRTWAPIMTYHVEGEEYRVIGWDKSAAFSIFLVPSSNAFPLITSSLLMLYILKKSIFRSFHGNISESLCILKAVLGDLVKQIIPSTRFIGKLIIIHLAALLWLAFNWICIVDLFLKGASMFAVILSVGSSAALSYLVVMRLGRKIEESEEDFHAGVAGGKWEEVLVENR